MVGESRALSVRSYFDEDMQASGFPDADAPGLVLPSRLWTADVLARPRALQLLSFFLQIYTCQSESPLKGSPRNPPVRLTTAKPERSSR